MSIEQLVESIALGKQILDGAVDLMELDERSLAVRGKSKGGLKRKERDGDGDEPSTPQKRKTEKTPPSTPLKPSLSPPKSSPARSPSNPKIPLGPYQDLTPYLKKIALSHTLTPFRKKVLTVLCQVPPGKYTTYGALSKYLSSSPRAVGNALKNNPFAPNVPCHRVLASGGGIGGFKGSWGRKGEEGVNDVEKRELLRAEGVKFDGLGRVCGGVCMYSSLILFAVFKVIIRGLTEVTFRG